MTAPPHGQRVLPYLGVTDAAAAIRFAQDVFGAELAAPPIKRADGSVWIAELVLAPSRFLIAQASADDARPGFLYVYVEDCDAVYQRALDHGAKPVTPLEDQFYGDRNGGVVDPWGGLWWIARFQETLAPDELQRRADAKGLGG